MTTEEKDAELARLRRVEELHLNLTEEVSKFYLRRQASAQKAAERIVFMLRPKDITTDSNFIQEINDLRDIILNP
jgi:hypothetical protein